MAMEYKNYADFVKSGLHAVAVNVAQPQMTLCAVLVKKGWGGFERVGNLSGLCAATEHQQQIKSELANVETLDHPFKKDPSNDKIQGFWKSNKSGFLGVVVPDVAEVRTWMKGHSIIKYQVLGVITHFLKDEYLTDIIGNGKWKPNVDSLKELYIIHEIVLTTEIKILLSSGAAGGTGARVDFPATAALKAGLTYSQNTDGGISICGVMENGHRKPFPIAFRTAHIKYTEDFKLAKPMRLGVRRGEDDGGPHLSALVAKDEKYHIGEFFLNIDEEEEAEPTIVPINFDENSELAPAGKS